MVMELKGMVLDFEQYVHCTGSCLHDPMRILIWQRCNARVNHLKHVIVEKG